MSVFRVVFAVAFLLLGSFIFGVVLTQAVQWFSLLVIIDILCFLCLFLGILSITYWSLVLHSLLGSPYTWSFIAIDPQKQKYFTAFFLIWLIPTVRRTPSISIGQNFFNTLCTIGTIWIHGKQQQHHWQQRQGLMKDFAGSEANSLLCEV